MSNESQAMEDITPLETTKVDLAKSEPTPEKEAPEVKAESTEERSYKEVKEDGTIKLDLSKLNKYQNQQNAVQEQETNASDDSVEEPKDEASSQEVVEKVQESVQNEEEVKEEVSVIEEVTSSGEEKQEEVKEEVQPASQETKVETQVKEEVNLPENIQELVKFMEETGGTVEDYVRLNADYSEVDNNTLLREYYKQTKPHLDNSEISFLLEDNFSYDEELDDERDVKKKKLAMKEEIAKAKKFLTNMKDQYYKEIKLNSKLSPDERKAIDFYNQYNEEKSRSDEETQKQTDHFLQSTNKLFNENFKGFEFNVGEKTYRYNVSNVQSVKEYQSDLVNFVGEFLDDKNMIKDAKGYHKALYAGKNIDKIVKHFYEQGKADAIKETAKNSKNIDMSPRTKSSTVDTNGMKIRVVNGDDSSKLKFKIRK